MALDVKILEDQLKLAFKKIEKPLEEALDEHWKKVSTNENSLYEVQVKIDKWIRAHPAESDFNVSAYKKQVWTETSKEWAASLSEHISTDVTKVLMDEATPAIAQAIDLFIRSGTVNTAVTTAVNTIVVGAAGAIPVAGTGTGAGIGAGVGTVT
jgi:hypothetical protein